MIPIFLFEELVSHIANVKAEDVDETIEAEEYEEDAPIDEESFEPPEECLNKKAIVPAIAPYKLR